MELEKKIFGDGEPFSSRPRQNRDTLSEDKPSPPMPQIAYPTEDKPSPPMPQHNPPAKRLATEILGALNSALDPFLGAEPPKTKPSRATVTKKPDNDHSI